MRSRARGAKRESGKRVLTRSSDSIASAVSSRGDSARPKRYRASGASGLAGLSSIRRAKKSAARAGCARRVSHMPEPK